GDVVYLRDPQLEDGNVATTPHAAEEDLRSEFATYVRTATENSAELSRQIQLADGKAVDAKSYAQQTATVIKTRLESLETYKDAEGTRASQYLSASRTETAKQLSAERAAIASNYVAKSTYDENVRGTTLKLNEIKSTADTAKQNLATYQNTVDRKLEELTSSTQTLDGKINTASAKVDTVAGQIRTEISNVEGKIPTAIGATNYIRDFGFANNPNFNSHTSLWKYERIADSTARSGYHIKATCTQSGSNGFHRYFYDLRWARYQGRVMTYSVDIKASKSVRMRLGAEAFNKGYKVFDVTIDWQRFVSTDTVNFKTLYSFPFYADTITWAVGDIIYIRDPQLEDGTIATTPRAAEEDLRTDISSIKTTITQTSQGVEQLSTSLSTTNNKVSTAETKINQLIGDVSSKVSQTDYNTLTGRMDSAETAITQNATEISKRLTSTQVEQAISAKGFATTTVVENKVRETAESFSRTISEVETKIPTEVGTTNLIRNGQFKYGENNWSRNGINQGSYDLVHSQQNMLQSGLHFYGGGATTSYFGIQQLVSVILHAGTKITVSVSATKDTNASNLKIGVHFRKSGNIVNQSWKDIPQASMTRRVYKRFHATFELPTDVDEMNFMFLGENSKECNLYITDVKVAISSIGSDWSPAPEDLVTVTALHNVTDKVDSHTRTIGAVGETGSILDNVSKVTQTAAGLVAEVSGTNGLKTQVSTLAGSYAIKNLTKAGDVLGQINLNKDGSVRINEGLISIGERTYIKDGVIKSAMIGNGQIGTAHIGEIDAGIAKIINLDVSNIKGLDAEFIKAKIENAFIGWMKGKTITAQNGNMIIDLLNGMITMRNSGKFVVDGGYAEFARQEGLVKASLAFHDNASTKNGIKLSVDDGLGKSTSIKSIWLNERNCYISDFDEISLHTASGNGIRITKDALEFTVGGNNYIWGKTTFDKISKL
ncbi:TPA: hypothetical protein U0919_001862, partial [Streptococcus suis]|nr:hypothetical protein [Streptococcus suis]